MSTETISIGNAGDPTRPVIEYMEALGLSINKMTITRIRAGEAPGTELDFFHQLKLVEKQGSAAAKNKLFLSIAESLCSLRKTQKRPPFRYMSHGLVEATAKELKLSHWQIGACLNGMRADFLSQFEENPYKAEYYEVMQDFFTKHTNGDGNRSAKVWQQLADTWDRSPESVYRFINNPHRTQSKKNIGKLLVPFVPYEADYLKSHYEWQGILPDQPFSPLDKALLALVGVVEHEVSTGTKKMNGVSKEGRDDLNAELAVSFNPAMAINHLKALAYGEIDKPLREFVV